MSELKGYSGPFDEQVEQIIRIFEDRAGLSKNMGYHPKIGNVNFLFLVHKTEPFAYDINTLREIYGEFDGKDFVISLAKDQFSQDPGKPPYFHHRSIPSISIPGHHLFLFRLYPEYYKLVGDKKFDIRDFADEVIHSGSASEHIIKYAPKLTGMPSFFSQETVVKTDSDLFLQKKEVKLEGGFEEKISFDEVRAVFDKFFNDLINYLRVASVKTRGMAECED